MNPGIPGILIPRSKCAPLDRTAPRLRSSPRIPACICPFQVHHGSFSRLRSGIIGEEKARSFVKPLLNKIRDNIDYMYTGVPGKSISDTRTFIQKSGINNLSETDRALFGTYSLGRKLDIYYVRDIDTLTTINPISTRVTSAPSLFAGKILKSDDRIYYPPILTIEINDQEKEVIFLNHEAKFLIKGDVVKFRAVEKIIENSVSNNWNQGDTVMLATDLINCHPTNK